MNPFKSHYGKLFADRETIDQAMDYANRLINSISDGQDKIAAMTALMVLVNTASKLWPEAPEAEAFPLGAQVQALAERVTAIEAAAKAPVTQPLVTVPDDLINIIRSEISAWAEDGLGEHIENWADTYLDNRIESWAEDGLGEHIENWADTYLDNRIESWAESNIDVEDQVRETLRNATLSLDI